MTTTELDPHGDQWVARMRREHERHEGLPVYPGTGHMHPPFRRTVPVITSAMLAQQRRDLEHARARREWIAQAQREDAERAFTRHYSDPDSGDAGALFAGTVSIERTYGR